MKILYSDGAFNQPYGGVAKYYVELIKHLPSDCQAELCQRTTQNYYLQEPPFNIPKATHTQWNFWPWLKVRGKWMIYRFLAWTLRMIPSCEYENRRLFVEKLEKGDFDVLHITDPHKYTFEWTRVVGKKPVVMTIVDLIPDMNPKAKRFRKDRARVLKLADHIIAISEYTKQDIVRMYGVAPEKITVVPLGYDERGGEKKCLNVGIEECLNEKIGVENRCAKDALISTNSNIQTFSNSNSSPYLLYVGGRRGYKNFAFFAKVAAQLMRENPDLHLVCTGGKLSADEMRPFADLGVEGKVRAMYVEDRDFPSLYAHAAVFVYPSRYEGFGIPILDAFHHECPVVLSRCSCFPEVGGDAALYFDDGDEERLREQILRVMSDGALREKMIAAGKTRAALYTWQRCADETVKVYRRMV